MAKFEAKNLVDFKRIVRDCFGKIVQNRIIFLIGELGAGKTTLAQEFAKLIGVTDTVISPSFQLAREYRINNKDLNFKKMIHIDLYRLPLISQKTDFIELFEYIYDPDNIIFIEWADKIDKKIIQPDILIKLSITGATRKIEIYD